MTPSARTSSSTGISVSPRRNPPPEGDDPPSLTCDKWSRIWTIRLANRSGQAELTGDEPAILNRELSWLDFNARVLALADDPQVPLLERVKFLAIFSSNLDEFFQVRVAALKDQVAAQRRARRALTAAPPAQQLEQISDRVGELVSQQEAIFHDRVMPALAAAGIWISDWDDLDDDDRKYLIEVFEQRIFPVLTPLAVDPGHPLPVHLQPLAEPRRHGRATPTPASAGSPA